ncbi:hypothetical protein C9994_07790 [Marivirga lumbricoides]|uniref:Uncharacterized protein n=1 Tax=Marivirga lumbricoides TaxID=1046115 RepID=A0A2T4DRA2_9BACT|nr:hypothetical protein C9994_07790 [Marivirga lumbricoides]
MTRLRKVKIKFRDSSKNIGYFHRFVYLQSNFETETKALIELESGDLELIDLISIKFIDKHNSVSEKH